LTAECQSSPIQLNLLLNKHQANSSPSRASAPVTATAPANPSPSVQAPPVPARTEPEPDSRPAKRNNGWAPREKLPQASASQSDNSFSIVAGSFAKKSNADGRLTKIKQAGLGAAKLEKSVDGTLYIVIVGQFPDRAKAIRSNQDFRRKTQLKSFVRED
jgi:cell division septation protein DedD